MSWGVLVVLSLILAASAQDLDEPLDEEEIPTTPHEPTTTPEPQIPLDQVPTTTPEPTSTTTSKAARGAPISMVLAILIAAAIL
jgi:hypothetical protein